MINLSMISVLKIVFTILFNKILVTYILNNF
jgi:hypothetical protein